MASEFIILIFGSMKLVLVFLFFLPLFLATYSLWPTQLSSSLSPVRNHRGLTEYLPFLEAEVFSGGFSFWLKGISIGLKGHFDFQIKNVIVINGHGDFTGYENDETVCGNAIIAYKNSLPSFTL